MEQGVEVIAANFVSPFCRCDKADGCRHEAAFVSRELGIELKIMSMTTDYLEMLKRPKHGYGSHMNPCIDCRILMMKKARQFMEESGALFLVTGEVLGQRPMSQRRDAMRLIEREAGLEGLIVRPLSAKLLEPTIPEKMGWVDRQRFLEISGRSRRAQMKLAEDYEIKDYRCAAGGCLLTDPAFSERIRDLKNHGELMMDDVLLLNHGRHFRLTSRAKLIVGRNERENEALKNIAQETDLFFSPPQDSPGASAVGRGDFVSPETVRLAARLVARYFDKTDGCLSRQVRLLRRGRQEILEVEPFSEEDARRYLLTNS